MSEHHISDFLDKVVLGVARYIYPHWLGRTPPAYVPEWIQWLYSIFCAVAMMIFISVTCFFLIWWERKVAGQIQRRMGPMTTGPQWKWFVHFLKKHRWWGIWFGGWLQTPMDALKLLQKEDIIPAKADRLIFITAPFVVMTACFMTFLVIPFGPHLVMRDLNIGVLYLLAVSSFTVIGIIMGGWGSSNKYSLLGGIRSAAQIISYEVPMIFSLLSVMVISGSLRMGAIVDAQMHNPGIGWFIVPLFIGFIVYLISAVAEINRTPFDLPEAESELVAGFNIEYSGMRFAMFYLAEFTNMFVVAAIATAMFLGGWTLPFGIDPFVILREWNVEHWNIWASVIGAAVFLIKTYCIIFIIMWTRWTFPRLRGDHLMGFSWKVLLPLAFLNLLIACIWVMVV